MRIIATLAIVLLAACSSPSPASPTETRGPTAAPATTAPTLPPLIDPASSWIEVDLARQMVILHQGGVVLAEYPASTGVANDPQYATPPGLYQVQSKDKGPLESVPGVFVSDVVMFDLGKGNGFHSRPADAQGRILDETLGAPATAGCVRVGQSAALFEFAEVGMKIWIH